MASRKKATGRNGFMTWLLWGLLAGVGLVGISWAQGVPSQLAATLIDRQGNTYEVDRFTYQGVLQIEYYVGNQRRVVPLADIERIRFEGEKGREELGIEVTLRTRRQERGTILTGSGILPHEDALGVGGGAGRFNGTTSLGPLDILLSEVREVIMRHSPTLAPAEEIELKATIVTSSGERFEVDDLLFRGGRRLYYGLGARRRFVDLEKVARIDLGDGGADGEIRPLTIVYWSGRAVQGSIEAGTVRLAGETDRSYYERVNAAFTGQSAGGEFSIGLHRLRQIRFHPREADDQTEEADPEAPLGEADGQAEEGVREATGEKD